MISLPSYLPLLDHIKDFFPDTTTLNKDRDWLINWATRIETFRMQQHGSAISKELVNLIEADFAPLMDLLVRLNSNQHKSELVDLFHRQADEFYRQLSMFSQQSSTEKESPIKDNDTLAQNWLTEVSEKTTDDPTSCELISQKLNNEAVNDEQTFTEYVITPADENETANNNMQEETTNEQHDKFFGSLFDDDDW